MDAQASGTRKVAESHGVRGSAVRRVLVTVLIINAVMFFLEFGAGR